MKEIFTSGSERDVKFFYKAEYCGTPQSKEKRNREYKVCLNERALRLLDHDVTWKSGCFSVPERGDFSKNSGILQLMKMGPFFKVSCVQSFAIWLVIRTGPRNSDNRLNSIATCGIPTHRCYLREGIALG